jgi:hypothetical protein
MNTEEEPEPYMDLMITIAEVMIAMKEHIRYERIDARNPNDRDQALEALGEESSEDRQSAV